MWIKGIVLFYLLVIGNHAFGQNTITVDVSGLRNMKGTLYFTLFKSEQGFPDKYENAIQKGKLEKLSATSATFSFSNVPAGTYAVAVFHDENNDGEMKTNALGIPLEGTAVSNNAKGTFGPPKFKDAKFQLTASKKISITMWYF